MADIESLILKNKPYVDEVCEKYDLKKDMLHAMILNESHGNTWAMRYEPKWHYFYKVPEMAQRNQITEITEQQLQSFSYGLLQVMGGVARELQYFGPLPQLLNPSVGLEFGCKKLKELGKRYDRLDDLVSAYNAGTPIKRLGVFQNQGYVDKFFQTLKDIEYLVL